MAKINKIVNLLLLISIITITQSCGPVNTAPLEIADLYISFQKEEDGNDFLDFYETKKQDFWDCILGENGMTFEALSTAMTEGGMNEEAVKYFIPIVKNYSGQHKTLLRNSNLLYGEGLACLENVEATALKSFERKVEVLSTKILPILSKSDYKKLVKLHKKKIDLINKRQKDFKKSNSLTNGQLGKNITAYNQMSFELIKKIHSANYGRNIKLDVFELSDSMYKKYPDLQTLFEQYVVAEKSIVTQINSDACKKRIGILRHNDGSNSPSAIKAQKANMLMNAANYYSK